MAPYVGQRKTNMLRRLLATPASKLLRTKTGTRYVKPNPNKLKPNFKSRNAPALQNRRRKKNNLVTKIMQPISPGIVTTSSCTVPQKGNLKYNKYLLKDRTIPTYNYSSQDGGVLTAACGFQGIMLNTAGGGSYSYCFDLNAADTYAGILLPDMKNYNPYYSSVIGISSTKLCVTDTSQKISFTNQSNTTAEVFLYDCVGRFGHDRGDTDFSPELCWIESTRRTNITGTATYNHVGATPFQQEGFGQNFKVLKVTKMYLTPGQTHVHTQYSPINHMFTVDSLDAVSSIPYKTSWVMCVAKGMPVTEASASVVSTAPCKIIALREIHYSCKMISTAREVNRVEDNLTTLTTPYCIPLENAETACTEV